MPADQVQFHQATGLDGGQIATILEKTIERLELGNYVTTSLSETLLAAKDTLSEEAARVRGFYLEQGPSVIEGVAAASVISKTYPLAPITEEIPVTNTTDEEATVELLVRRGSLPVNWQTSLSADSLTLAAGEVSTVTLTIDPGPAEVLVDVDVHMAVEGYIDDDLLGGALVRQRIPVYREESVQDSSIYLPFVVQ